MFIIFIGQKKPQDANNKWCYFTIVKKIEGVKFYLHVEDRENIFDTLPVKALLSSIARQKGKKQKQARRFTLEHIVATVKQLDLSKKRNIRNKAILLVGFQSALRSSELLQLRVGDISHTPKGLILEIGRNKTNQFGTPSFVPLYHGRNPF